MTILEVVFAVAMLALVVSMLGGAVSFMRMSGAVSRRHAEAAEAAHRIIIQHLEDPNLLASGPQRVDLNGTLYGYHMYEYILTSSTDEETDTTFREQKDVEAATLNEILTEKLHMVTVEVFLDDPDLPSNNEVLVTLSRVYNPMYVPHDSQKLLDFINNLWLTKLQQKKDEQQQEEQSGGGQPGGGGATDGGGGGGAR